MVIPTTILLTLFAAKVMGYTINRVSLFALIFSIGILVDDAIVVVENIARHWAMKDGRSRMQAAIEAVAEVGNPTVVATLTVVAALLPMLFVSGLMGPYMAPIPANASAAMLFSFFVAMVIAPWLMLKLHPEGSALHESEDAHGEGRLGKVYRRFAGPILATRKRAWIFLIGVGVATVAVCVLFYTESVTVKLLPFDNKSEMSVVVDLPEGATLEDTERTLFSIADVARKVPEVRSIETYAGTPAPFNFNGLVRHYYIRESPELGELHLNLAPKSERHRTSHEIALDLRARMKNLTLPAGTVARVVEVPPGPPVLSTLLAEVYGPDSKTRRDGRLRAEEDLQVGALHRRRRRFDRRAAPAPAHLDRPGPPRILRRAAAGRLRHHPGAVRRHHGGLFAPRRGPQSDRDRGAAAQERTVLERGARLHAGAGQRAARLQEAWSSWATWCASRSELGSPAIFRRDGHFADMVMAEMAGAYEAPIYGMLAVDKKVAAHDWGKLGTPAILIHGQPEDEAKPSILWDGEWEITYVTFRDMGAAFMVAIIGIYILVVAQFGSFKLPLVILTPIPLTLIGIVLGHWLFGAPFTATSMIGFIALAGIIVRNSILLVDFIRHGGGRRQDAARDIAGGRRGALQADPVDRARRHDRRRHHPARPDLPGPRHLAAVRPGVFDAADGAGDPGDLRGVARRRPGHRDRAGLLRRAEASAARARRRSPVRAAPPSLPRSGPWRSCRRRPVPVETVGKARLERRQRVLGLHARHQRRHQQRDAIGRDDDERRPAAAKFGHGIAPRQYGSGRDPLTKIVRFRCKGFGNCAPRGKLALSLFAGSAHAC